MNVNLPSKRAYHSADRSRYRNKRGSLVFDRDAHSYSGSRKRLAEAGYERKICAYRFGYNRAELSEDGADNKRRKETERHSG